MNHHRIDRTVRVTMVGLAAAAALAIAACGGTGAAAPSSPLGVIDQATRTVQLNLIITASGLNGYSTGQMTVRVPRGWKVDVYCANQASTPRSCAIVSGDGSVPAFPGVTSSHPASGVPAGGFANFSFVARTPGSYRVASLVHGHPARGMWERFDVVAAGKPSVSTSAQPGNQRVAPGM